MVDGELIVEFKKYREGPKRCFLVWCQGASGFHADKETALKEIRQRSRGYLVNKFDQGLPLGDALEEWMNQFDEQIAKAKGMEPVDPDDEPKKDGFFEVPLPVVIDASVA